MILMNPHCGCLTHPYHPSLAPLFGFFNPDTEEENGFRYDFLKSNLQEGKHDNI